MTKDDVLKALRKYFLPLFDPSSSAVVVVTSPSKAEEIGKDLSSKGFDVEQRTLDLGPDEDSEGSESGSSDDMETGSEESR